MATNQIPEAIPETPSETPATPAPTAPAEDTTEAPATDTAQPEDESAEPSQSPNEELIEILKRFLPDADTSSPDALIADATKVLTMMVPIYDQVFDIALVAPESASFVHDLLTTGDVAKSIARNYDPQEFQALCEEVQQNDDYEGDRSMHKAKVAKAKARISLVKGNMDVSMNAIAKWEETHQHWEPAKAQEFQQFVLKFYQDGVDGMISEEALSTLEKGFTHDGDVTDAEEVGKVTGRNEKIVSSKLSKEKENELLPEHLSGKVTPPPAPAKDKPYAGKFLEGVL